MESVTSLTAYQADPKAYRCSICFLPLFHVPPEQRKFWVVDESEEEVDKIFQCIRSSAQPTPNCVNYAPNYVIVDAPCGHMFHWHCLATWWEHNNTCPHDRIPMNEVKEYESTEFGFVLDKRKGRSVDAVTQSLFNKIVVWIREAPKKAVFNMVALIHSFDNRYYKITAFLLLIVPILIISTFDGLCTVVDGVFRRIYRCF